MTLTIKTKLLGVLGMACAALAISAVLSLASLSSLAAAGGGIYDRGVLGMTTVSGLAIAIEAQSGIVARAPTELNLELIARYKAEFAKRSDEVDKALTTLAQGDLGRARAALLNDVRGASAALRDEAGKVFGFASRMAQEQALLGLQGPFATAESRAKQAVERLVAATSESAKADAAAMNAVASRTGLLLIGAAIVLGVVVAGAGWLIARGITRPLKQTVAVLEALALGDFTGRLDVHGKDEVGQMAAALNQAVDGMQDALHEVRRAADQAASASQQLSAAAEQLSSGAQEQASSLEETAASLEQITGTVKQNADNARHANQLAVGSHDVAEKGGRVVAEAVDAMSEINTSSKKIADIITTIDEIAFQTNLLALNAAVEAARAGEQGRGFAVVAAEVRNLAQRSASAAKEIKGLIQDSVAKVDGGSKLVNKSGETLSEIVSSVKRVTDIIAEIAAASGEQTTGIDQVNKAVTQMDQVTQSNAAQTEELSSTAQSLAAQAQQLQALVARFKLGDEGRAVVAPVARSAPAAPRAVRAVKPSTVSGGPRPGPRSAAPAPVGAHIANGHAHTPDGFEEF